MPVILLDTSTGLQVRHRKTGRAESVGPVASYPNNSLETAKSLHSVLQLCLSFTFGIVCGITITLWLIFRVDA